MADNFVNPAMPHDPYNPLEGQLPPRGEPLQTAYNEQSQFSQAPQQMPQTQQAQQGGMEQPGQYAQPSQSPTSPDVQIPAGNETQPPASYPPGGYVEPNVPASGSSPVLYQTSGGYMESQPPPTSMPLESKGRSTNIFCWCCCFLFLLIIVATLGVGIYAYYSEEEIPVVSGIVRKVEEILTGKSSGSDDSSTDLDQEEVPDPFDTQKSYTMEGFGLDVVLPEGWDFKKIDVAEVAAKSLSSWLRDSDEYEEEESLDLTKYQISSSSETINIGILLEAEEYCELATSQPKVYKCFTKGYTLNINNTYVECAASITLKKEEAYSTEDTYEVFTCEIKPGTDSIWKKIVIQSTTISDNDLSTGDAKNVLESISET